MLWYNGKFNANLINRMICSFLRPSRWMLKICFVKLIRSWEKRSKALKRANKEKHSLDNDFLYSEQRKCLVWMQAFLLLTLLRKQIVYRPKLNKVLRSSSLSSLFSVTDAVNANIASGAACFQLFFLYINSIIDVWVSNVGGKFSLKEKRGNVDLKNFFFYFHHDKLIFFSPLFIKILFQEFYQLYSLKLRFRFVIIN